jgi:hypothetical protein
MSFLLYNTDTQKIVRREQEERYSRDGVTTVPELPIVELEVINEPYPENLAENERAVREDDACDFDAKTLTRAWRVETFEPDPWRVSKDTLWSRLKAAIGLSSAVAYIDALTTEDRVDWDASAWFWSNGPMRARLLAAGFTEEQVGQLLSRDPYL